ncbi:FAD binding domain-containing protein [Stakelama saccharophila]|uniref:Xanthine dehydrogenase family protein subunit M n=1 Tax=Stakelama saccharophila TaxID=3075605 RepID=A0ABZ0BBP4_9SPHN|nr:xanthine dehydrogenase family protein subunit M [Stakelama sp. W311]WNO53724.1 xanthine dehydrogenase family protein subunit M [Stakelama sp. W311]
MRPFTLDRPADTVEALRLGGDQPAADAPVRADAQYLAGGTTLLDLMKLQVMTPARLIDIAALEEEHGRIEKLEDGLWLGAMVPMADAADDPLVREDYPVIADALWQAASPQLRNMARLGGNVLQRTRCNYFRSLNWGACNKRAPGSGCAAMNGVNRRLAVLGTSDHCIAHYPGDFAVALVSLGAEVSILGADGTSRTIAFEDLHRLPGDTPHIETNLAVGDLITGFRVPAGAWTRRSLYLKVRDRASYDFALASAAVALDLAEGGIVRTARIGLGGLAAKPWRAHEAEVTLSGSALDEASARRAAEAAFADAETHGGNDFKPELGRRTLVRALLEAQAKEVRA